MKIQTSKLPKKKKLSSFITLQYNFKQRGHHLLKLKNLKIKVIKNIKQ